jgi:hypothetical protein
VRYQVVRKGLRKKKDLSLGGNKGKKEGEEQNRMHAQQRQGKSEENTYDHYETKPIQVITLVGPDYGRDHPFKIYIYILSCTCVSVAFCAGLGVE